MSTADVGKRVDNIQTEERANEFLFFVVDGHVEHNKHVT